MIRLLATLAFTVFLSASSYASTESFGGNERIDCGSATSIDDVPVRTISAWFKVVSTAVSNGRIATKFNNTITRGWALYINTASGSANFFYTYSLASAEYRTATSSITTGNWYHILMKFDRTQGLAAKPVIYLNGTLQALTAVSTPTGTIESDAGESFFIGNGTENANPDRIIHGPVAMWSTELFTADAMTLYNSRNVNAPLQIKRGNLIGFWPQNSVQENGGATATMPDLSGLNNHCTPLGSPTGRGDSLVMYGE